jgi:hypothetical protein
MIASERATGLGQHLAFFRVHCLDCCKAPLKRQMTGLYFDNDQGPAVDSNNIEFASTGAPIFPQWNEA